MGVLVVLRVLGVLGALVVLRVLVVLGVLGGMGVLVVLGVLEVLVPVPEFYSNCKASSPTHAQNVKAGPYRPAFEFCS